MVVSEYILNGCDVVVVFSPHFLDFDGYICVYI